MIDEQSQIWWGDSWYRKLNCSPYHKMEGYWLQVNKFSRRSKQNNIMSSVIVSQPPLIRRSWLSYSNNHISNRAWCTFVVPFPIHFLWSLRKYDPSMSDVHEHVCRLSLVHSVCVCNSEVAHFGDSLTCIRRDTYHSVSHLPDLTLLGFASSANVMQAYVKMRDGCSKSRLGLGCN